jgi:hypothetical protein
VRKESARERTRLEKKLATCNNTLERAMSQLTIIDPRVAGMERASEQQRRANE